MSEQYKLTNEEINKAVLHSPYALADTPYKNGLGAGQIKKYFYDFIYFLGEKLNIHLGDIGDSVEDINTAIGEIEKRLAELHETDTIINSSLNGEIDRHISSSSAHPDIRELVSVTDEKAQSATTLATSAYELAKVANTLAGNKPNVYFEQIFSYVVGNCIGNPNIKNGDIFIVTEKTVPDFLVFSVGQFDISDLTVITEEDLYNGNLPTPQTGDKYLIKRSGEEEPTIGIVAIESGVDTSGFVTREELNTRIGDIETALDSIIAIQNSLIGGDSV